MTSITILITGAAGKLGKQLTKATSDLPGRLEGIVVDLVADGGSVLAGRLQARDLLPDAVVNNAIDLANQRLPDNGLPGRERWRIELELAVIAPFNLVMALAAVPDARLSAVVNISSMYGVVARNPSLYADPMHQSPIHCGVAKAAMIHLTKKLAIRLAPRNIRVDAVSFGGVEGRVDPAFMVRYAKLCPSGRMLHEKEIPASVAFLVSESASGITGHNLVVDGGWAAW